jgi:predicted NodU family carbamoyl transferase
MFMMTQEVPHENCVVRRFLAQHEKIHRHTCHSLELVFTPENFEDALTAMGDRIGRWLEKSSGHKEATRAKRKRSPE